MLLLDSHPNNMMDTPHGIYHYSGTKITGDTNVYSALSLINKDTNLINRWLKLALRKLKTKMCQSKIR